MIGNGKFSISAVHALSALALIFCAACQPKNTRSVPLFTPEPSQRLTDNIFFDPRFGLKSERRRPTRVISDKGLSLTKEAEGFVGTPYDDAAHFCTIGYGHLIRPLSCSDDREPISMDFINGITEETGSQILKSDFNVAQVSVEELTKEAGLSDNQYAAVCDFVFNVGSSAFRNSTLRAVLNSHQDKEVALQFRRWVLAGGKVVPGLLVRREHEISLYFDGVPQSRRESRAGYPQSLIDISVGEPETQQ